MAAEAHERVEQLFADEPSPHATVGAVTGHNGKLDVLTNWLHETCDAELAVDEMAKIDRDAAWQKV